VQPRTSPDGTIVMSVYAEKSFVGPDATGIPIFTDAAGNVIRSPQIPITTAQTIVSAKSGQTIILGGLITQDQTETTNRIPYAADIPVLGRLFRFDIVEENRTELLIIMTPFIVSSAEQIEWMNARESERMSWCIADVANIHGPVGMSGNPAFNGMESPLIFPDVDPAGQEPTPAEPQTSQPEGVPGPGQPTWYQPPTGLAPPRVQLAVPPAGTTSLPQAFPRQAFPPQEFPQQAFSQQPSVVPAGWQQPVAR
jgi:general secretion pathway protein D